MLIRIGNAEYGGGTWTLSESEKKLKMETGSPFVSYLFFVLKF